MSGRSCQEIDMTMNLDFSLIVPLLVGVVVIVGVVWRIAASLESRLVARMDEMNSRLDQNIRDLDSRLGEDIRALRGEVFDLKGEVSELRGEIRGRSLGTRGISRPLGSATRSGSHVV